MPDIIGARDAHRRFSTLSNEVEGGKSFVITRNGVPVAQIGPLPVEAGIRQLSALQEMVLEESLARLRKGWSPGIGWFDRNELYDDAR